MSRASSVWVVVNHQGAIAAGFTVKHEMITWLSKLDSLTEWVCYRLPDNPSHCWQSHRSIERHRAKDLL